MTRSRFADLVVSFRELPCGVCSEEFKDVELPEFVYLCISLLNRDSLFNCDMTSLFDLD